MARGKTPVGASRLSEPDREVNRDMPVRTEARAVQWRGVDVGAPSVRNPAYGAFLLLRTGFTMAPILFGIDKFFNWMVTWERYLWPEVASWFNASPETVMDVVGAIEIAAGLVVLLAPRVGSLLVAGWLGTIIVNLVAYGIDTDTEYWDIALRDFGLMLGALALFLLATAYAGRRKSETSEGTQGERSKGKAVRAAPADSGSARTNPGGRMYAPSPRPAAENGPLPLTPETSDPRLLISHEDAGVDERLERKYLDAWRKARARRT